MAKASVPLMKDEYKRRAVNVDRDDSAGMQRLTNAVLLGDEAKRGWCGAIMGIVILAIAVWGVIGGVL